MPDLGKPAVEELLLNRLVPVLTEEEQDWLVGLRLGVNLWFLQGRQSWARSPEWVM